MFAVDLRLTHGDHGNGGANDPSHHRHDRIAQPFAVSLNWGRPVYRFRTMVRSQAHSSLTIARLAAAGGVGVETIRFYQRKGLLGTPPRDRGIRRYGIEDVRRLRFIRQAQGAGFTLKE